tara:strand:+ start:1417 stop:2043 length:627 start_codon:yes stop_codon:yes gene_type:complete
LIEALVEFHKTVPPINKTASAQYGKFADLETVLSTVTPHLLKNGLVVSQGFEPSSHDNNPVLVTQLLHVSGAQLVSRLPMVVAGRGKNPLHDWGGSCTYSRRYSLLSILGLTADMDVDGDFADEKPAAITKPAAGPSVAGVSKQDQPLSDDERNLLLQWITDMPAANRNAFCDAFRSKFKLDSTAKVAPAITSKKHEAWIQAVMNEYA